MPRWRLVAVKSPCRIWRARRSFPIRTEWAADVAALARPCRRRARRRSAMRRVAQRYLGVEVPRSPLLIYAIGAAARHERRALWAGARGFRGRRRTMPRSWRRWALTRYSIRRTRCRRRARRRVLKIARPHWPGTGVKLGLQYDNNWNRPSSAAPEPRVLRPHAAGMARAALPLACSSPRSVSPGCQISSGICIGAGEAGYVSSWPWAPPVPDRPWGEAMIELLGTRAADRCRARRASGRASLSYSRAGEDAGGVHQIRDALR